MKRAFVFSLLLMLVACGERVRSSAPPPEPACDNPAGQPAPQNPSDATEGPAPASEPEPIIRQPGGDGFQADKPLRPIRTGYSRQLRVLYLEQRFRWQARALSDALERDEGLLYQGFFFDAQEGWTQPTSNWSDDVRRELKPLGSPFFEDGKPIGRMHFLGAGYDVVIVGDIDPSSTNWDDEYWEWLDAFVTQGGGLILAAGQNHNPVSHADDEFARGLFPVKLEVPEDAAIVDKGVVKCWGLTSEGRDHELFHLSAKEGRNTELWGGEAEGKYVKGELHGLYWHAVTGGLKKSATALARVASEGESIEDGEVLVASKVVGEGRVLYVGTDDTHYWRQWVGDHYFYKFWQNAIRWAANDPGKRDD